MYIPAIGPAMNRCTQTCQHKLSQSVFQPPNRYRTSLPKDPTAFLIYTPVNAAIRIAQTTTAVASMTPGSAIRSTTLSNAVASCLACRCQYTECGSNTGRTILQYSFIRKRPCLWRPYNTPSTSRHSPPCCVALASEVGFDKSFSSKRFSMPSLPSLPGWPGKLPGIRIKLGFALLLATGAVSIVSIAGLPITALS